MNKTNSPCYQCNNRIPGCHSYCEVGMKWDEEQKKLRREKADLERMDVYGAYDFLRRETPSKRMRRLRKKAGGIKK